MRFSLDQKLLEQVINHLAGRPYQEVQGLIAAIQQDIKPVSEDESR